MPKIFRYTLAFPDFSGTDSTAYSGIDIGDVLAEINLNDAVAVEGDEANQQLSGAAIGRF